MDTEKRRSFSAVRGRKVASTYSTIPESATSARWTSILPASTLDRSRMSLISWSRSVPAVWIVRENSTWRELRLPSAFSASSLARMSSELSGVRSSCDMFARNSDL